jgi:hypothetical protein
MRGKVKTIDLYQSKIRFIDILTLPTVNTSSVFKYALIAHCPLRKYD